MSVSEFLIAYVQIKEAIAALTPSPLAILLVAILAAIAAAGILGWRARSDYARYLRISRRFAALRA